MFVLALALPQKTNLFINFNEITVLAKLQIEPLLKQPNIIHTMNIHVQADMVEYYIKCTVLYFLFLAIINTQDKNTVCVSVRHKASDKPLVTWVYSIT